ncbi:MAG: hypothetical protein GWO81_07370, partial [Verrucomicrobia bacterium]|nr:hypothetical protein [Verrucomicrobiota bacterium]
MKKQSLEKLTGLTAASIAMGVSTEAAIIASPTVPSGGLTTPSSLGTIYWDIDNDGTDDFSFTLSSLYTNITSSIQTVLKMADLGDARVAGVDGNPLHFKQLTGGTYLGTTSDGFSFSPTARNRSILSFWSSTVSSYLYLGTDLNDGGWSLGDTGYFGFKFTSNGNTHYGWA